MTNAKHEGPVNRISLGERLDLAWADWNLALAGLAPEDFERPVYRQWTLKDILGHVCSYVELDLRHVRSYKKRKRLASPRAPPYSYFNRREAQRLRNTPPAQLCARLEAAYRGLAALVPALTDQDLRQVFPSQWSNSKYHTTLRALLREEAEHMRIHAADIVQWRERMERLV
ncbi:MAG: maleylpyruvate isomerase N-terminal domain-containing protein, partial [Chloroflexi bacterium]|nr:maleylpyruvate isomerase N-terminal domain-containing protein [Chloroflexota bacterium]